MGGLCSISGNDDANQSFKSVSVSNISSNKNVLVYISNDKSTTTTATLNVFCNYIKSHGIPISPDATNTDSTLEISGFISFNNVTRNTNGDDTDLNTIINQFIDNGWISIMTNKNRKFAVLDNKMVYISAIDSNGSILLNNYNSMELSFVYDGNTFEESNESNATINTTNNSNKQAQHTANNKNNENNGALLTTDGASSQAIVVENESKTGNGVDEPYPRLLMKEKYANITFMGVWKEREDNNKRTMPNKIDVHACGRRGIERAFIAFKQILIDNEAYVGYIGFQCHQHAYYTIGEKKGETYKELYRVENDIPNLGGWGHMFMDASIPGFNGIVDTFGGGWENAVYKVELGKEKLKLEEKYKYITDRNNIIFDYYKLLNKNVISNIKIEFLGIFIDNNDDKKGRALPVQRGSGYNIGNHVRFFILQMYEKMLERKYKSLGGLNNINNNNNINLNLHKKKNGVGIGTDGSREMNNIVQGYFGIRDYNIHDLRAGISADFDGNNDGYKEYRRLNDNEYDSEKNKLKSSNVVQFSECEDVMQWVGSDSQTAVYKITFAVNSKNNNKDGDNNVDDKLAMENEGSAYGQMGEGRPTNRYE